MLLVYIESFPGANFLSTLSPSSWGLSVPQELCTVSKVALYLSVAQAKASSGNYKSAIDAFEGGSHIRTVPGYSNHSTAGIFCTYPAAFMSRTGMFFSEFIASTILMFCIYALYVGLWMS